MKVGVSSDRELLRVGGQVLDVEGWVNYSFVVLVGLFMRLVFFGFFLFYF